MFFEKVSTLTSFINAMSELKIRTFTMIQKDKQTTSFVYILYYYNNNLAKLVYLANK